MPPACPRTRAPAPRTNATAFDAAISQAAKEAEMADKVIAKAVAAGNGEDVTQAMRYRDQALARIQQLNSQKQRVQQRPPQPKQQIDDRTMHYAQEFIKENPWYDSQGRDEDSSIVIAIDQAMAKPALYDGAVKGAKTGDEEQTLEN